VSVADALSASEEVSRNGVRNGLSSGSGVGVVAGGAIGAVVVVVAAVLLKVRQAAQGGTPTPVFESANEGAHASL